MPGSSRTSRSCRSGRAVCRAASGRCAESARATAGVARHRAALLAPGGRTRSGPRAVSDLVVVTGTASGKTLCYNLPILEAALADPQCPRALSVSHQGARAGPAQGPAGAGRRRRRASSAAAIRPGVYDGDTPTAQRRRIRGEANLVLSNPDMLHAAVLPYHPKWAAFFAELRYVVVDEVHTYRGILGAHVSAVLRRLQRVCEHYGSRPVFLAASATIANPGELASRLIGRDVAVIDDDGSPRGRKYFALWNPTPLGRDSLARRSASDDAVTWLVEAIEAGGQALAFTRTRQAAELIHRYAREQLAAEHSPLADKVRAYRGGYLPNERREIEQDLFSGKLRGVAATNALELGIDIGTLDVALLVNYPGTIASSWQQAGRSGRRHDESLAVLLAGNDPVDQYLLRHPEYFFAQTPEHAVVDPNNPYVLAKHLPAAAFELPLARARGDDLDRFGPLAAPIAGALEHEQQLVAVKGSYYFAGGQNPAVGVSLRHMSDNTFSIVLIDQSGKPRPVVAEPAVNHTVIANVDAISAPELVYPEAVYLHNGETYLVRELDLTGKVAYVERRETDYYTQAVLESNVRITGERATRDAVSARHARLRRRRRHLADRGVQEDQVRHAREHRPRAGRHSGPESANDRRLARAGRCAAGRDEGGRPAGERRRVRAAEPGDRRAAARGDVRQPRPGRRGRQQEPRPHDDDPLRPLSRRPGLQRARLPAHAASCLAICLEMVRDCPCDDGCPSCVGLPNLRPAIHSDPDLMRGYPMPNKQATVRLLELAVCRRTRQIAVRVAPQSAGD